MDTETALKTAGELLAPLARSTAKPETFRLDAVVDAANLLPAVNALIGSKWGYLAAMTGLDRGPQAGQIEALYFFCGMDSAAVVILRVPLPRDGASVPSVCGPIPSATLYEREFIEMFGVNCVGTPNSERLFLPEQWPADAHPLRKDFVVPGTPA